MTRLEAHQVGLLRGGKSIVSGVSLALEGGQFVGLIGPNGAGKSTLLSLLAGLLAADTGMVTLDGTALAAVDRRRLARVRAYLPQNPRAEWPVSTERLIALGLTPHLPAFGDLPPAMAARVAAAIEQMDLAGHREQAATTLSGGELARAMLARALIGDPQVLLVDEPLTGLDPRHALDGAIRLRALADEGRLVVAALHQLSLAARYTTHLAVMDQGRVIAFGPTSIILTAELLRQVFEVDARVSGAGTPAAIVDFVPAPPRA